jgi:predicted transcriptional regulator
MKLDPNTTIYLEIANDAENSDLSMSIQIITGEIKVERKGAQKKNIRIKNKSGIEVLTTSTFFKMKSSSQEITKLEKKQIKLNENIENSVQRSTASVLPEQHVEEVIENKESEVKAIRIPEKIKAFNNERKIKKIEILDKSHESELGHITRAIRKAKNGQVSSATQHVAEALAEPEYYSMTINNSFPEVTRMALDSLFLEQKKNPDCLYVKDLIKNVHAKYKNDGQANSWARNWVNQFKDKGCRF